MGIELACNAQEDEMQEISKGMPRIKIQQGLVRKIMQETEDTLSCSHIKN